MAGPQVIQIKRHIGATSSPPSGLADGELSLNAFTTPAPGSDELYVGDTGVSKLLVGPGRQVEITGAQTITGIKTIANTNLRITGGTNGNVLQTDGAGNISWEPLEPGGLLAVNADAPLTGNGTSANALGVEMATTAQINTGTDDVYPIDSAGLRTQTGDAVANLTTTAKTIVPAINELDAGLVTLQGQVSALAGALRLVGTYDVAQDEVTPDATGVLGTAGDPLPAAAAANEGWFVIATSSGVGTGNAPNVQINEGDWLVSTGTSWIHIPLMHAAQVAANIGITQINAQTWTNVQQALEGLYAQSSTALQTVAVDGISIIGDGTTADPLEVHIVDGGTY